MPANTANTAELNPSGDELQMIWGAKAIGTALNLSPRQAFLQLEAGRIPGARKFGWTWSASGVVLCRVLTAEALLKSEEIA